MKFSSKNYSAEREYPEVRVRSRKVVGFRGKKCSGNREEPRVEGERRGEWRESGSNMAKKTLRAKMRQLVEGAIKDS